tara:strand:+ start:1000 stop:1473 length:474 start_codon:yes stop_codon:yes gene_type:complete
MGKKKTHVALALAATPSDRTSPRAMTMTTFEVLTRLNKFHRKIVFPRMFNDIHFDMVHEVEYHFKLDDDKRLRVTSSVFWLLPNRSPEGSFTIEFSEQPEEGRTMGRWLHNIVDPHQMMNSPTGAIGFTMDPNVVKARKETMDVVAETCVPSDTMRV